MEFQLLFKSCCSAAFELVNKEIYFSNTAYNVYLDGKLVISQCDKNVFSIYDLQPDTKYKIIVGDYTLDFTTKHASCIMHMSDFSLPEDRTKDITLIMQTAINILPKDGLLIFDPGEYHFVSLFLKSDITISLCEGALLLGTTNQDDYPIVPGEIDCDGKKLQLSTWEGSPEKGKNGLIYSFYQKNIQVVGKGIIDSRGPETEFYINHRQKGWARPYLVYLNQCEDVNFHGIEVRNSPSWTYLPYFCNNIGFYDLMIKNPKDTPNTDGIDPECSSNIDIIGVHFSVGDDCIAIKSGKIYIGKTYQVPSKNITIRNCHMEHGHGGIVLGSEASAGIKNVTLERCFFDHTDRGLRIKSRRGRGKDSVITDIHFLDIRMDGVLTPLVINMFYFCDPDGKTEYVWSKDKLPVDDRTPYLGNFTFERITATNAELALGYFYGLPEQHIGSIKIKDSTFTMKENSKKGRPAMMSYIDDVANLGFYFNNVENVIFENVTSTGYKGKEVILNNVGKIERK